MNKRMHCNVPDCNLCSARDASVFSELVNPELESISKAKGSRGYAKGEMIFYADQFPAGLYCINSGKVKVYKVGKDGREQIVRLAKAGDIIGYRSLISGEKYSAYAVPLEDAAICHIPRDTFFTLLTQNHHLSTRVLSLLSHELKSAEDRIVDMAQKPVRERLAETLLLLQETYGMEKDNTTLGVKLTRVDLANIVGTATESVSRLLSKFKEEKIIDMQGRKIKIVDRKALVEAANVED
jgi:CRP/FNR family transcriptional regulator